MKRLLQRIPGAHLATGAAPTASPEKAGGGSISSPPPTITHLVDPDHQAYSPASRLSNSCGFCKLGKWVERAAQKST